MWLHFLKFLKFSQATVVQLFQSRYLPWGKKKTTNQRNICYFTHKYVTEQAFTEVLIYKAFTLIFMVLLSKQIPQFNRYWIKDILE